MATTYTLISNATVGSGGAANIEFTSIPSTYTDLCVWLSGRTTTNADNYGQIDLSFNGAPSGTSYSWRKVMGTGSVAHSANLSDNAIDVWSINGSGSTASTFGNNLFYIHNYTSSNYKSVSIEAVTENNANTQALQTIQSGLWNNTSVITSIRFTVTYSGNFSEHSTAYLYGIKNS